MFKSILVLALATSVLACSSGSTDTPEDEDLLSQLIDTTWASNSCDRAYGNDYSKHEISFNELSVDYEYLLYDEDCINVLDTYSVSKSFTIGEELTTKSGVVANQFNVLHYYPPVNSDILFRNIIYLSGDSLYIQGLGCEHRDYSNFALDEMLQCAQRPNDFDFDVYYTKKI